MSHHETLSKDAKIRVRATSPMVPVPKHPRRIRIDKKTGRDTSLIFHNEIVLVDNSSYYRRQIRKGDLEIVAEAAPKTPANTRK